MLAWLSWIIPIVAFFIALVLSSPPGRPRLDDGPRAEGRAEGAACAILVFYLVGLVVAIVALVASQRHGPANIQSQAIAGIVMNVILLVIAVVLMIR
jgi:hypothetical protein